MKVLGQRSYSTRVICGCGAIISYDENEIERGGFLHLRKGIHCPKCHRFIPSWRGIHQSNVTPVPFNEFEDL